VRDHLLRVDGIDSSADFIRAHTRSLETGAEERGAEKQDEHTCIGDDL